MLQDYCYIPDDLNWEDPVGLKQDCTAYSQGEIDEWIVEADTAWFPNESTSGSDKVPKLEERFRRLTAEWSSEVGNISSVSVLTSHPKYQEIIRLGWDIVPFLLADLQQRRGYWFTALNKITGIRPFDPSDAGNNKRMTEAWIKWGRDKGII